MFRRAELGWGAARFGVVEGPASGLGVFFPRLEAFAQEQPKNDEDPRDERDGQERAEDVDHGVADERAAADRTGRVAIA